MKMPPKHALPFRQAQGRELTDGPRTPKAFGVAERESVGKQ